MSYSAPPFATRKTLVAAARSRGAKRAPDGMRVAKDFYGAVQPLGARSFQFVLSTAAVDREGDSINQAGWILQNYLRNPVVLLEHGYHPVLGGLPIGRTVDIAVAGGKLKATVTLDTAETPVTGPYAEMVRMKLDAKSLFACSVGFIPLDFDLAEDRGDVLDASFNFKRQELYEWSIVGVPCNPEALADAAPSAMDDIRDSTMSAKSRVTTRPGTGQRWAEVERLMSRWGG